MQTNAWLGVADTFTCQRGVLFNCTVHMKRVEVFAFLRIFVDKKAKRKSFCEGRHFLSFYHSIPFPILLLLPFCLHPNSQCRFLRQYDVITNSATHQTHTHTNIHNKTISTNIIFIYNDDIAII